MTEKSLDDAEYFYKLAVRKHFANGSESLERVRREKEEIRKAEEAKALQEQKEAEELKKQEEVKQLLNLKPEQAEGDVKSEEEAKEPEGAKTEEAALEQEEAKSEEADSETEEESEPARSAQGCVVSWLLSPFVSTDGTALLCRGRRNSRCRRQRAKKTAAAGR